jgi:hypothetical protein
MQTELNILALYGLLVALTLILQTLGAFQQLGMGYLLSSRDEHRTVQGIAARLERATNNSITALVLFAPAILHGLHADRVQGLPDRPGDLPAGLCLPHHRAQDAGLAHRLRGDRGAVPDRAGLFLTRLPGRTGGLRTPTGLRQDSYRKPTQDRSRFRQVIAEGEDHGRV